MFPRRVAGEEAAEGELAQEVVGQIAPERPAPIVEAYVDGVAPLHPGGSIADVPHRLVAGLVVIHRAAAAGDASAHAAKAHGRIGALLVIEAGEHAGLLQRIEISLIGRRAMLIRGRLHVAEAELIHQGRAQWHRVRYLPVAGLLHEEDVAQWCCVAHGDVGVVGVGHSAEERAPLA